MTCRQLAANRALTLLVVATVVVGVLIAAAPTRVPLNVLTVPMILSALVLRPRQLARFISFAMVVLFLATTQQPEFTPRLWASVATYTVTMPPRAMRARTRYRPSTRRPISGSVCWLVLTL